MTYAAETLTDDYTDFGIGYSRDSSFHGVQDNPSDWAVGSDEAGDRVYSPAAISDFLQCDLS